MNNEPVAWMLNGIIHECDPSDWAKEQYPDQDVIPLYTHPIKELKNIVLASATCSCGKVMEVTNLQTVKELTDEEILNLWWDSDHTKDEDDLILTFVKRILKER